MKIQYKKQKPKSIQYRNYKHFPEYTLSLYKQCFYKQNQAELRKNQAKAKHHHCVKSDQIRRFFWSVFSWIQTEYRDLRSKSLYSVWIQGNTDQKKLRIWTFFTQCTLRLNFCYLKIIHILHPRYHPEIIGHILKNKQNNR